MELKQVLGVDSIVKTMRDFISFCETLQNGFKELLRKVVWRSRGDTKF